MFLWKKVPIHISYTLHLILNEGSEREKRPQGFIVN